MADIGSLGEVGPPAATAMMVVDSPPNPSSLGLGRNFARAATTQKQERFTAVRPISMASLPGVPSVWTARELTWADY